MRRLIGDFGETGSELLLVMMEHSCKVRLPKGQMNLTTILGFQVTSEN